MTILDIYDLVESGAVAKIPASTYSAKLFRQEMAKLNKPVKWKIGHKGKYVYIKKG